MVDEIAYGRGGPLQCHVSPQGEIRFGEYADWSCDEGAVWTELEPGLWRRIDGGEEWAQSRPGLVAPEGDG